MTWRRLLSIILTAALCLVVFTAIATQLLLRWNHIADDFDFPYWQWWEYLYLHLFVYPHTALSVWLQMVVFGVLGALAPALGARAAQSRNFRSLRRGQSPTSIPTDPLRSPTDNHGHARWATVREMRRRWPGPDPVYGGVVVGEAYDPIADRGPFHPHDPRTWGRGGRRRLLIDPCYEGPTHWIFVASSGGFKSMCFVSTLLHWKTSAVVLDPAHELAPMVRSAREKMGHQVFVLDTKTADRIGFNVLGWIDISRPEAEGDVGAVVEWVCGGTPVQAGSSGRFFKNRGKAIVKCFVAHLLWDTRIPEDLRTLSTVRDWISAGQEQIQAMFKAFTKIPGEPFSATLAGPPSPHDIWDGSPSHLARQIAGGFVNIPDDTWGGIVASADDDTSWLTTQANAQLVSGNSFHASDITRGNTDVFIQLSLKVLQSAQGLARCIIGALLNAVYEADGDVVGRALFIIDEAKQVGYHGSLKVGRDAGRKAGITILMGYQSEAQIEEQWGGRVGKEEWYQTVSGVSFSVINEVSTAKHISDACGTYGGLSWSESFRRRFSLKRNLGNISYSDRPIPLVRASEILAEMRTDAQIIMPGSGHPPVRCGRPIYFRRREMARLVKPSHFIKKDRDVSEIVPEPETVGTAGLGDEIGDLESEGWPEVPPLVTTRSQ